MAMGIQRGSGVSAPLPGAPLPQPTSEDDFEEISLADIVRVLHRRKVALAVVVVLALVGGGALTVMTTPQFEAEAIIIPLEHQPIIRNWLESRQAAETAVASIGAPLYAVLYPQSWDATSESFPAGEPSRTEMGRKLMGHVKLSGASGNQQATAPMKVTVTLPDAALASQVATAYIASLDLLRPQLEEITRSNLFDRYYDGTNAQEAQARAERAAAEKNYWIVFDSPAVPDSPASPKPALNMALALVLGVMGGVFVVFFLEWLAKYRSEYQRPLPPP